tara:strand:- start:50 stop:247 length:198 start_codon:yes stop_codon:yes gene_type:complete
MSDIAQLEMRLCKSNDKISQLKGDVRELKELVKVMQLQLKDHMEAEIQRRSAPVFTAGAKVNETE